MALENERRRFIEEREKIHQSVHLSVQMSQGSSIILNNESEMSSITRKSSSHTTYESEFPQGKQKILSPHKAPEPENKNKNHILIENSSNLVSLDNTGYHMIKAYGDKIFTAGRRGLQIFKEDLGHISLEKSIDQWKILCIEIWEDRNLLFALEEVDGPHNNHNLLVFDSQLNLIRTVKFDDLKYPYVHSTKSETASILSTRRSISNFHRRDNLIIWNYG